MIGCQTLVKPKCFAFSLEERRMQVEMQSIHYVAQNNFGERPNATNELNNNKNRTDSNTNTKIEYAPEYCESIQEYYEERQKKMMPKDYIKNQKGVNENCRAIAIDWIIDVAEELDVVTESAFLAVNIMDRYLEKKEVKIEKFQLVTIVCLSIAMYVNCISLF